MRLRELIKSLDLNISDAQDFEVKGITCDSRQVKNDFIFVAINGNKMNGNLFIPEAVKNGARLVILDAATEEVKGITFIRVNDSRIALATLAADFYGYPSRKMKVVGITGTNGKTTITYLIEHILRQAGYKAGVIGTINYRFQNKVISAKNTTPGAEAIQSLLAQMYNEDIRYVAMEVSSHALDQGRVKGVDFSTAVFTNLTQDHLDYHKDMEEYFRAKSLLFKNLNSGALAVINKDSPFSQRLINSTSARVITYSLRQGADIAASKIKLGVYGTSFYITSSEIKTEINTKLIGRHNVYNILAAFAFALQEGLDAQDIKKSIEGFSCVPGRLEEIDLGQPFKVFVDYAHTEDALFNVITSLKEIAHNRIIVVFGCGGDRDAAKRPKMGRVTTELADKVIITADNPRSENAEDIIKDILKGVKRDNYKIVVDRGLAIKEALTMARNNDIVLLAGKGHEDYQVFKDRTINFDDREEARKCLLSLIS
ncbi:MAG: UDP-N-acetylmuramoyl-L-alanyl-D-glutamate--2,6-diaminopimelate ligase [Candidatus Omnitrophica bacterium]|nr:UDP-N-acetylmuramoyl-L-alanyl-D-glutamate--2,6-diaminopimelate ligase [Candidatus Omnitrophota bacterium]MDD5610024.1 UDP-N-acetylmuramoyl-L-alanyl-D-glutamate--2,6-diaminopimelate ligase [Candidatus Omnitrophota bacterium]